MKKQFLKNKIFFVTIIFLLLPLSLRAQKETYPKLANYYQKWSIENGDEDKLSNWDLLILDMENQNNSKSKIQDIKKKNPEIETLAYITSHEILRDNKCYPGISDLRCYLHSNIQEDWYLHDGYGQRISFWDNSETLNVADGEITKNKTTWTDFLPGFITNKVLVNNIWDGVFYDGVWHDVAWLNSGNIDINNDHKTENPNVLNNEWKQGQERVLQETRNKNSNKIIVGNGSTYVGYQKYLNGVMYENFPTPWEGNGKWSDSMGSYLNVLPAQNKSEQVYIVNSNTANTGTLNDYKKMRFGLASTLLGDGYFSFDYGDQDHAQTWWYDEYDVSLGLAQSKAYNLSDKNNSQVKPGLWRRDFEFGISLVNSTNEKKTYVFSKEEFEKINGTQDRRVNNGTKTNYVTLEPNDGLVLKKINNEIRNNSFNNGSFARVFDKAGKQTRNGFFAYKDQSPGNTQIMVSDIDDDGQDEMLVNGNGTISIYDKSKLIKSFKPYDGAFKGEISFAVGDLNGDGTKEIITGAGAGGGPHVRTFSKDGKLLSGGFFAYDKNFRGGVNVAVLDLNGDGTKEIITGAGAGGGPHIRTFSSGGKLLTGGFFAYDKNFRGGVDVSVGEVDGDGVKEIIVAPGKGGGPQVRIFSTNGKLESQFFAYGQEEKSGLQVMADDLNNDGLDEILVSLREMN